MKKYLIVILILVIYTGCNVKFVDEDKFYGISTGSIKPVNNFIRERAYFAAEYYLNSEMKYEWGGDDIVYVPVFNRGIDCSGLIINVYKYAIEGSRYSLPFTDSTADEIYNKYSENIVNPQKGDLIIWTDNSDKAFHIALFEKIEKGKYFFIESNQISSLNIDGVAYRSMELDTPYNINIKRLKLVESNS